MHGRRLWGLIGVKYFFICGQLLFPFLGESVAALAAVGMWETRRRFPRTVGSGVCFPSVRHLHGRFWVFTILLWLFWPVRLGSSGC